jgi:hypothetical protein
MCIGRRSSLARPLCEFIPFFGTGCRRWIFAIVKSELPYGGLRSDMTVRLPEGVKDG